MVNIETLKYWCHKVLPLVYDDSLSYYEVLCKVSSKLNEVIDTTNEFSEHLNEQLLEMRELINTEIARIEGEFDVKLNEAIKELTAPNSFNGNAIVDGSITDNKLVSKFWHFLNRVPVRSYADLDDILNADNTENILRLTVSGLGELSGVIGAGDYVCISNTNNTTMLLVNTETGVSWIYEKGSNNIETVANIPDNSITDNKLVSKFWHFLNRVPVRSYADLNDILNTDNTENILRLTVSGLGELSGVIGAGDYVCISNTNNTNLLLVNTETGARWIYEKDTNVLTPIGDNGGDDFWVYKGLQPLQYLTQLKSILTAENNIQQMYRFYILENSEAEAKIGKGNCIAITSQDKTHVTIINTVSGKIWLYNSVANDVIPITGFVHKSVYSNTDLEFIDDLTIDTLIHIQTDPTGTITPNKDYNMWGFIRTSSYYEEGTQNLVDFKLATFIANDGTVWEYNGRYKRFNKISLTYLNFAMGSDAVNFSYDVDKSYIILVTDTPNQLLQTGMYSVYNHGDETYFTNISNGNMFTKYNNTGVLTYTTTSIFVGTINTSSDIKNFTEVGVEYTFIASGLLPTKLGVGGYTRMKFDGTNYIITTGIGMKIYYPETDTFGDYKYPLNTAVYLPSFKRDGLISNNAELAMMLQLWARDYEVDGATVRCEFGSNITGGIINDVTTSHEISITKFIFSKYGGYPTWRVENLSENIVKFVYITETNRLVWVD